MASLCVALQLATILSFLVANSLGDVKVFPSKSEILDINNELWLKESNLIEAPEPTSRLWQVFEKPKMQKFTANYVKSIVKALYKFDSYHKHQQKTIPRTEDQEVKSDSKPTIVLTRNIFLKKQSANKVNNASVSSPIPPAVEDLSDIGLHLSSQIEADKSQKFTHSIRYGYGKSSF